MAKEYISINIKNNTNGKIPMSIMGNPANLADISNQTIEYSWDVTSLALTTENTIVVEYKANGMAQFTSYTTSLSSPTLQGVLDSLNTLGIGSFFSTTSGGNTFIKNYDNSYEFGLIDIYDSNGTSVLWSVDCIGTTGNNDVQCGLFLVSQANPFTGSVAVPVSFSGEQVDITGTTSNQPTTKIKVKNLTTNVFIINVGLGSGVGYTYTFNADFGNAYLITIQDY
jgi:hypothetical protein